MTALPSGFSFTGFTTLDEFSDYAKESVEDVGRRLEPPDGDWLAVALAQDRTGAPLIVALAVDPEEYGPVLHRLGTERPLRFIATVLSSWSLTVTDKTADEIDKQYEAGWRVSADPGRKEILVLGTADHETEVWWEAPILRSKTTIALGEWTRMDGGMGGRQPGTLRAAIRAGDAS